MTTPEENSYYFVSLGRERGGLLDELGLPPNASELEIGKKEGPYRKGATDEVKRQRIALDKRQKAGEITKEEVEAKTAELKEQMDAKLTKLNELRAKFDRQLAERRKRRKRRHGGETLEDESGWSEMPTAVPPGNAILDVLLTAPLARLTDDDLARIASGQLAEPSQDPNDLVPPECKLGGFLAFLGLPPNASEVEIANKETEYRKSAHNDLIRQRIALDRCLQSGEITKEEVETKIAELRAQWEAKLTELNELVAKFDKQLAERRARRRRGETLDDKPSRDAKGLATLRRAVSERRLFALLHADRLWGKLKHTNRKRWTARVQEALADGTASLPRLGRSAESPTAEPLFPSLSQPVRQQVTSLRAESLEKQQAGPQRGQQNVQRVPDFRDLLAALARQGGLPAAGMPEADVEAFRRFMAAMMPAEAQNEDADDLDGQLLDQKGAEDLSTLPSRSEMRATFLATLLAVPQNFLRLLGAGSRSTRKGYR